MYMTSWLELAINIVPVLYTHGWTYIQVKDFMDLFSTVRW